MTDGTVVHKVSVGTRSVGQNTCKVVCVVNLVVGVMMEATLVRREGLSEEVILLFLPRSKTGQTELIPVLLYPSHLEATLNHLFA